MLLYRPLNAIASARYLYFSTPVAPFCTSSRQTSATQLKPAPPSYGYEEPHKNTLGSFDVDAEFMAADAEAAKRRSSTPSTSSTSSLFPKSPRKSRVSKRVAELAEISPAFSMRTVAESPWLQEDDAEEDEVDLAAAEANQQVGRFDWRQRSRAGRRVSAAEDALTTKVDSIRRIKRYRPISHVLDPGEQYYGEVQDYKKKFLPLLNREQEADEIEVRERLEHWPLERLIEEGYCLVGLMGFWLDATQFGRPVAVVTFGPGQTLAWNRFENGSQVRLTPSNLLPDGNSPQGSIVQKTATQIRIVFDEKFRIEKQRWRIDLWSSDIAHQRMRAAIQSLNNNPSDMERDSEPTKQLILQGTHLRDLLLQGFAPKPEPQESDDGENDPRKLPGVFDLEDHLPALVEEQAENQPARRGAAFAENQLIRSWATRYAQPNPIVVEGDPVVNLNSTQTRAMAMMIGERLSLIQGPPGTGKTATIAETVKLLKNHFAVPHPMLICTYTNVAVDHLLEALVARGVKPLRVGYSGKVKDELERYTLDAQLAAHPLKKEADAIEAKIIGLKRKMAEDAEKLKDMPDGKKRDSAKKRLEKKVIQLQGFRKNKYKLDMTMLHEIVHRADVICTTCLTSASAALQVIDFPVVFLDEASMCTEPASLVPIMKGCQHLALIGDHKQLPPILVSEEARAGGLGISLFERLLSEGNVPSIMLDQQYRMHPDISNFPSKEFYAGAVKDGTVDAETGLVKATLEPPESTHLIPSENGAVPSVVFLDHSGLESRKDRSRVNHGEAAIVCSVIEDLLLKNPTLEGKQIGVIAPYAAQITLLDRLFRRDKAHEERFVSALGRHRALEVTDIEVKTVDGFEGREKDVIVFSTVRNNMSGYIGFLADGRRLNVGLTRAKRGLFVVGSKRTLRAGKVGTVESLTLGGVAAAPTEVAAAGAKGVKVDVGVPMTKDSEAPLASHEKSIEEEMIEEEMKRMEEDTKRRNTRGAARSDVWARYLDWLGERGLILSMVNDKESAVV
ncbi:hypothetical protein FRC02_000979 [Tulasnella sp. 418]|nr:hypothetical protein FRC02_000979 [Tulasnella sp. 418]